MRALLAVALALLVGGGALARGGDPIAADALWAYARAEAGDDLTHPVYVDAMRELARVRPWQPGFEDAQARIHAVERARRSALR